MPALLSNFNRIAGELSVVRKGVFPKNGLISKINFITLFFMGRHNRVIMAFQFFIVSHLRGIL